MKMNSARVEHLNEIQFKLYHELVWLWRGRYRLVDSQLLGQHPS